MFSVILIANRGEIACRVIRTARRLGIATVAIYSDADRAAMHVALADEAFWIGPPPARESYLNGSKILEVARLCGAEAIHPGYGFLAENADFAEACTGAGIVFIGPPPAAMRAMGDKAQAKALMEKAGVPLVPGYHGGEQDEAILAREALALGYPVMIKPSAGGGGKGMKIAADPEEFEEKLASAKREALSAFGDTRVIIEKFLERARHVEVQILADGAGNCVHLFDRDCSIQRRHQKIIEEAPAPQVADESREAMRKAALGASRAIDYIGAGTVEFLISPDDGAFYFLEMNTRLQVEHPVTEMITGIDLVEWQIEIAAGGALPLRQEEILSRGHAIEARIYAEDPARGFLPQAGRITYLSFPDRGPGVRFDTGVRGGDLIPLDYDPMIAKLIVWDEDRGLAIRRLRAALGEIRVAGLATNLGLLRGIAVHEAFGEASLDTGFVEHYRAEFLPEPQPAGADVLALAAMGLLCERAVREGARRSTDPWSPWNRQNGWRRNEYARETLRFREITAEEHSGCSVDITYLRDGWRLDVRGATVSRASGTLAGDGHLAADLDGRRVKAVWVRSGNELSVFMGAGATFSLELVSPAAGAPAGDRPPGRLTAPMPGRIAALLVTPGASVEANQPLLVLEAMKMEHLLRAPQAGILKSFNCELGDQVGEGEELATLEMAPPDVAS